MLLLDKPYVSDVLKETAKELGAPILDMGHFFEQEKSVGLNILPEADFLAKAKTEKPLRIYCNSENSINWIAEHLKMTEIPAYIDFCKDKVKFRESIKEIYPKFAFQEVLLSELAALDVTKIKKPFIIKPAVGFFSIGVHKVKHDDEWDVIVKQIEADLQSAAGLYPTEVMNASRFIIEECIDGEEFAIDAYYNGEGEPVILDILHHVFSSDTDMGDRVYFTSKDTILEHLQPFQEALKNIGAVAGFRNFPVHAEVRIDSEGNVAPIEFNPMRFAGWCVGDLAYYAFGINLYDYYLNEKAPDWEEIFKDKGEELYSLVLVDVPKGVQRDAIKGFDYDALSSELGKVLARREVNYREYPVFGFYFIEANAQKLDEVLTMDFKAFVKE